MLTYRTRDKSAIQKHHQQWKHATSTLATASKRHIASKKQETKTIEDQIETQTKPSTARTWKPLQTRNQDSRKQEGRHLQQDTTTYAYSRWPETRKKQDEMMDSKQNTTRHSEYRISTKSRGSDEPKDQLESARETYKGKWRRGNWSRAE
jgi:hypothetical protein